MATLFLRTIVIYVILLAAIRLMGKRQVGELEVSELVTTFLISELAVLPLSNRNAPLSHAIVPVLLLLSAEVVFSYLTFKSPLFRRIALGKPSIIINKGKLDRKELAKLRMSIAELIGELRLCGVASIDEVEYAVVEDNGKLSVFKNARSSPLTAEDAGLHSGERGIAHCLIADGRICDDGLAAAGRDREWLLSFLDEKNTAVGDVCFMAVDDSGKINIITGSDGL